MKLNLYLYTAVTGALIGSGIYGIAMGYTPMGVIDLALGAFLLGGLLSLLIDRFFFGAAK